MKKYLDYVGDYQLESATEDIVSFRVTQQIFAVFPGLIITSSLHNWYVFVYICASNFILASVDTIDLGWEYLLRI